MERNLQKKIKDIKTVCSRSLYNFSLNIPYIKMDKTFCTYSARKQQYIFFFMKKLTELFSLFIDKCIRAIKDQIFLKMDCTFQNLLGTTKNNYDKKNTIQ